MSATLNLARTTDLTWDVAREMVHFARALPLLSEPRRAKIARRARVWVEAIRSGRVLLRSRKVLARRDEILFALARLSLAGTALKVVA